MSNPRQRRVVSSEEALIFLRSKGWSQPAHLAEQFDIPYGNAVIALERLVQSGKARRYKGQRYYPKGEGNVQP
jgi:hypothetical protein